MKADTSVPNPFDEFLNFSDQLSESFDWHIGKDVEGYNSIQSSWQEMKLRFVKSIMYLIISHVPEDFKAYILWMWILSCVYKSRTWNKWQRSVKVNQVPLAANEPPLARDPSGKRDLDLTSAFGNLNFNTLQQSTVL